MHLTSTPSKSQPLKCSKTQLKVRAFLFSLKMKYTASRVASPWLSQSSTAVELFAAAVSTKKGVVAGREHSRGVRGNAPPGIF